MKLYERIKTTSSVRSCQINSISDLDSEQQLVLAAFVVRNDIFTMYCSVEAPPVLYLFKLWFLSEVPPWVWYINLLFLRGNRKALKAGPNLSQAQATFSSPLFSFAKHVLTQTVPKQISHFLMFASTEYFLIIGFEFWSLLSASVKKFLIQVSWEASKCWRNLQSHSKDFGRLQ